MIGIPVREIAERWMGQAIREAERAAEIEESPIGAVIVQGERIVGRGHNRTRTLGDPTAHAEIIAISAAAETLGDWRLEECDLYVTIEPCVMCAGAIVLARVRHVFFGAREPKFGGCVSLYEIPTDERLNHRALVTGGVRDEECAALMQEFFKKIRAKQGQNGKS